MARVTSAPSLTNEYHRACTNHPNLENRRVSWAFEHPDIPKCGDPTLDDMKSLLKKQIRSTVQTPDFIYLTVSALKSQTTSSYPYEYSQNQDFPPPKQTQPASARRPILRHRPQSSPSSIDTKTKVSLTDSMEELIEETSPQADDVKSVKSSHTVGHSSQARSIRSSSISRLRRAAAAANGETALQRAQSAQTIRVRSAGTPRCQSAESWKTKAAKRLPSRARNGLSTTATELSVVPMLMYPKEGLKPKINTTKLKKWPSQESIAQHHPMNSTKSLKLMTYTQQANLAALKTEGSNGNIGLNSAAKTQVLCST